MENLFQGCHGVSLYLDDLLVTGSTVKEHLDNLNKVLGIMATAGLTLNLSGPGVSHKSKPSRKLRVPYKIIHF